MDEEIEQVFIASINQLISRSRMLDWKLKAAGTKGNRRFNELDQEVKELE